MAKSFKTWIKQFRGENTRFGDLEADIQEDTEFPLTHSYRAMENHLRGMGASSASLDTFRDAFNEYDKQLVLSKKDEKERLEELVERYEEFLDDIENESNINISFYRNVYNLPKR
jgi:hypothetical protein